MSTAKTAKPMTCPVCGEPITDAQGHKNTIYAMRDSVPVSAQAHYPSCYLKQHPRPSIPALAQPMLFAALMN